MTEHDDDTQPIAPHRDLGPAEPPADADITSDGPGTPPITDADITETAIDLGVTKFGSSTTKWIDGMGEVEISEAPDEVMFVGSDATIEVWHRPQPAGKLAEASLVDADQDAKWTFSQQIAGRRFREATDVLLNHLLWTEATRAAAEPGEILPAFGLGEPPLYEVAAHAVQRETALQSAEIYRRSMEQERTT